MESLSQAGFQQNTEFDWLQMVVLSSWYSQINKVLIDCTLSGSTLSLSCPPKDSIIRMMTVWRITEKIIRIC